MLGLGRSARIVVSFTPLRTGRAGGDGRRDDAQRELPDRSHVGSGEQDANRARDHHLDQRPRAADRRALVPSLLERLEEQPEHMASRKPFARTLAGRPPDRRRRLGLRGSQVHQTVARDGLLGERPDRPDALRLAGRWKPRRPDGHGRTPSHAGRARRDHPDRGGVEIEDSAYVLPHRFPGKLLLSRPLVSEARCVRGPRLEQSSIPRRHRVLFGLRSLRRQHDGAEGVCPWSDREGSRFGSQSRRDGNPPIPARGRPRFHLDHESRLPGAGVTFRRAGVAIGGHAITHPARAPRSSRAAFRRDGRGASQLRQVVRSLSL